MVVGAVGSLFSACVCVGKGSNVVNGKSSSLDGTYDLILKRTHVVTCVAKRCMKKLGFEAAQKSTRREPNATITLHIR